MSNFTQEDRARAKLIRESCRDDLLAYSKFIKEDYDVQPFHEIIAEHLMMVER